MLTATSQYALRALVELAGLPKGKALLGRELASRCGIPPHYLTQIFVLLRNAGIIAAVRGRHGGYHLCRRPADVRLVDVIELFDGPRETAACFLHGERRCGKNGGACPAHLAWADAQKAYASFLKNTTLAHISPHGKGAKRASAPHRRTP